MRYSIILVCTILAWCCSKCLALPGKSEIFFDLLQNQMSEIFSFLNFF